MKSKTFRNVAIICIVIVVAGILIRSSSLADLGYIGKRCEGNGTCGMKYYKSILEEKMGEK